MHKYLHWGYSSRATLVSLTKHPVLGPSPFSRSPLPSFPYSTLISPLLRCHGVRRPCLHGCGTRWLRCRRIQRRSSDSTSVRALSGLKSATLFSAKIQTLSSVANGSRVQCMQVWNPIDNIKFETLSYLPPLTEQDIAKQVDYMIQQKLIPCLELDPVGTVSRTNSSPGCYDGRYWTMWKLPMFGCNDDSPVFWEIQECEAAYPQCYMRVMGFDNIKQVQIVGFLIAVPANE